MGKHYTYIYLDEKQVPYYVGKGINWRCFEDHDRIPVPPRDRAVRFDHDTEEQAYAHERELVAKYGRLDLGTGTLMNRTDGGPGTLNPAQYIREIYSKQGRKNVENGQLASVRIPAVGGRVGGKVTSELGYLALARTPEVCAKGGKAACHYRWHVSRGVKNPTCELCNGGL